MLIYYQVIMALAALFGISRLLKLKHVMLRNILVLQIISVVLSLINIPGIQQIVFGVFYLCVLLVAIYGIFDKGLFNAQRVTIAAIALPVFIHGIFAINNWPYVYALKFILAIPVILYLAFVLRKRADYKNELGPLTIIAADALIQVIILLTSIGES